MSTIAKKVEVVTKEWSVRRFGCIEEIHYSDGRVTYRVKIWDWGRDAFITQSFNDQVPALEFLDRVERENQEAFDKPLNHSIGGSLG